MAKRTGKRTLEAEEFVLKDRSGNRGAVLKMGEKGPTFYLLDDHGYPRVSLDVTDGGPMLTFYSPDGQQMADVGVSGHELILSWHDREVGLNCEVTACTSNGKLSFYDDEGQLLYSVPGRRFGPVT